MKKIVHTVLGILLFTAFVAAQTVYVTKTGKKYHSSGCSYLKSSISMSLEDALNKGYSACSRCSPPTNITSEGKQDNQLKPKVKKENITTTKKKSTTTSSRCQATTKKGTQCKRNASSGSNYCWQHK